MRTKFRFQNWLPLALSLLCASASATALAAPPAASSARWTSISTSTTPQVAEVTDLSCPAEMILGTGSPDKDLLSEEASVGVRAFWCERYDSFGNTERLGPYREVYSNGQIRLEAVYMKAGETTRLGGPVEIRNEDGSRFLRGFLKAGEWAGDLVMFHETGEPWFEGKFEQGRLDGPLRTHHADGALESETRYSSGQEQGLARSLDAVWPIGEAAPVGPAAASSAATPEELDASN